jgi:hypothetical protein
MKRKLFALIMKLMYKNLNKGDYGCHLCRESAEEILERIEKRQPVTIKFTPEFNIIHGEEEGKATVNKVFMKYHISGVDSMSFL